MVKSLHVSRSFYVRSFNVLIMCIFVCPCHQNCQHASLNIFDAPLPLDHLVQSNEFYAMHSCTENENEKKNYSNNNTRIKIDETQFLNENTHKPSQSNHQKNENTWNYVKKNIHEINTCWHTHVHTHTYIFIVLLLYIMYTYLGDKEKPQQPIENNKTKQNKYKVSEENRK